MTVGFTEKPGSASPEEMSATSEVGFGPKTARRIFIVLWILLLGFELWYVPHLDGRLNYLGNPHAEADTVRSAEAYMNQGLWAHHGLPRMLYGNRFPKDGTVKDHLTAEGGVVAEFRQGFPPEMADRNQWITTHCPPGADLINGVQAKSFGIDPVWKLRIFPTAVGLIALAFLFQTVTKLWGVERGALISVLVAILPMVPLWLPTLHYEGYALALVLIQTSFVLRRLWLRESTGPVFVLVLFLIGFFQGWLSWDHFFVVSLLALPWWLLRRADGARPNLVILFWMTAVPAAGFTLAHVLHLCMAVGDLGSWQAALGEFHRTGMERGGMAGGTSRLKYTGKAVYLYIRWCLYPSNRRFGPILAGVAALAAVAAIFRRTELSLQPWNRQKRVLQMAWPGQHSALPALVAALGVSTLWLFVMPQHVFGNSELTVRHLETFYLCMVVIVVRSFHLVLRGRQGSACKN